jgi:hypothetical protein
MQIVRVTSVALLLALGGSCDSYSPDLGQDPFRCGTDSPRCPEGYGPVQQDDTSCICQEGAPADDGIAFTCNTDPNEAPDGNESLEDPTTTTIGLGPRLWTATGVSLCEAGDVDVYVFRGNTGQTVAAAVTFDPEIGMLEVAILNTDGQELASGVLEEDTMEATLQIPAMGDYFVEVTGRDESVNNYALRLTLTSP